MNADIFIDTNILVYAYDHTERSKHERAKRIVADVSLGKQNGVVSNQVLAEFTSIMTKKVEHPLSVPEVHLIVSEILKSAHWKKINYTAETVANAINTCRLFKTPFWDSLIQETMQEHAIQTILTEDKAFEKIPGIEAINPFK